MIYFKQNNEIFKGFINFTNAINWKISITLNWLTKHKLLSALVLLLSYFRSKPVTSSLLPSTPKTSQRSPCSFYWRCYNNTCLYPPMEGRKPLIVSWTRQGRSHFTLLFSCSCNGWKFSNKLFLCILYCCVFAFRQKIYKTVPNIWTSHYL